MFVIDQKQLKRYEKMLKDAPRKLPAATAGVLNTLAFKTREFDIDNLRRSLIFRQGQITPEKMIEVKRAHFRTPINAQIAITGSRTRARFTGWEEQETGATPKTRRGFTGAARGGNYKNVTLGKARLKPNRKFSRPADFDIKNVRSENQRLGVFLKIMMERKNKSGSMAAGKQFVIPKYKGFKHGLYNYQGNRFQKYQNLDEQNKPIRRTRWRTASLNSLRLLDMRKIWERNIRIVLERNLNR